MPLNTSEPPSRDDLPSRSLEGVFLLPPASSSTRKEYQIAAEEFGTLGIEFVKESGSINNDSGLEQISGMPSDLTGGSFGRQEFLRAAGPFVFSETRHGPHFFAPEHVHERPSVTVVLDGGYAERGRGVRQVSATTSVLAKPAWSSHSNEFRERGAHCLLVEVQTSHSDLIRRATDLFAVPDARDGRSVMTLVHAIQRELRREDPSMAIAVEALGYELVTALSRVAKTTEERRPDAWLIRIRQMVEALPPEQLSLRVLAGEVNRHPAHVARAFKRRHGLTVGQYIRQHQLVSAAAALRKTRDTISRIATRNGFYDHSQFCREFRRTTGMTPTDYRAR